MNYWNPYTEVLRRLVLKTEGHDSLESFIEAIGGESDYHLPKEPCGYQGLGFHHKSLKNSGETSIEKALAPTSSLEYAGESKIRKNSKIRRMLSVGAKQGTVYQENVKRKDNNTMTTLSVPKNRSDSENDDENLRWIKR